MEDSKKNSLRKFRKKSKMVILHHNRDIHGTFYRPEEKDKFPIVILSHGYNGYETDFDSTAKYLATHGIGSFCYTFCGGSTRDKSCFNTTQMSLFTEKEDLMAVIDEVKSFDCLEQNGLYLFGASQGGMVSALTAEVREKDINGMILLYPALCIPDDWKKAFPDPNHIPEKQDLWNMMLGRAYFEAAQKVDIKKQLGKFKKPILIMHGSSDEVVDISYAKWAKEQYKHAHLEVFEGEGHGFSKTGDKRMQGMMLYFLHECM